MESHTVRKCFGMDMNALTRFFSIVHFFYEISHIYNGSIFFIHQIFCERRKHYMRKKKDQQRQGQEIKAQNNQSKSRRTKGEKPKKHKKQKILCASC